MKFVLVGVAVVVLLWMLRSSIRRATRPVPRPPLASPQAMLVCAHCGVHLPGVEALPGRGGVFCDAGHRSAFEAAHPLS